MEYYPSPEEEQARIAQEQALAAAYDQQMLAEWEASQNARVADLAGNNYALAQAISGPSGLAEEETEEERRRRAARAARAGGQQEAYPSDPGGLDAYEPEPPLEYARVRLPEDLLVAPPPQPPVASSVAPYEAGPPPPAWYRVEHPRQEAELSAALAPAEEAAPYGPADPYEYAEYEGVEDIQLPRPEDELDAEVNQPEEPTRPPQAEPESLYGPEETYETKPEPGEQEEEKRAETNYGPGDLGEPETMAEADEIVAGAQQSSGDPNDPGGLGEFRESETEADSGTTEESAESLYGPPETYVGEEEEEATEEEKEDEEKAELEKKVGTSLGSEIAYKEAQARKRQARGQRAQGGRRAPPRRGGGKQPPADNPPAKKINPWVAALPGIAQFLAAAKR